MPVTHFMLRKLFTKIRQSFKKADKKSDAKPATKPGKPAPKTGQPHAERRDGGRPPRSQGAPRAQGHGSEP